MLFFDSNNLISQAKLKYRLGQQEEKKTFYQKEILQINKDREELSNNPLTQEKFAREKYLMKRDNEEIILVEVE